ncbi:hypothetical protein B0T25DRAFT_149192 [Lasiosphaeria hispida]|uniref:Uncharacterized protein n=1 Tax=Lasiosphaeria hispida TaxID=260671 RepID=A0AAJ0HLW0_9PEZI|nr:hypothetical protein B0T25DRAFT_149192 [Lasiosphaeria hispida]
MRRLWRLPPLLPPFLPFFSMRHPKPRVCQWPVSSAHLSVSQSHVPLSTQPTGICPSWPPEILASWSPPLLSPPTTHCPQHMFPTAIFLLIRLRGVLKEVSVAPRMAAMAADGCRWLSDGCRCVARPCGFYLSNHVVSWQLHRRLHLRLCLRCIDLPSPSGSYQALIPCVVAWGKHDLTITPTTPAGSVYVLYVCLATCIPKGRYTCNRPHMARV